MIEDIIRKIVREELANSEMSRKVFQDSESFKPFAVYMGEGVVLTNSYFGVLYLVSSFDCTMTPHLLTHGVYESELTKYFLKNIREDSVFADVGANFGYYTCLAARKINQTMGGKVYAFEANKNAIELLQRNIMVNWIDWSAVSIHHIVLSDSPGEVLFKNYKYRFGGSQIYTSDENNETINTMEVVKVNTQTLDASLHSAKVDFIKIDVEGSELNVLKGAVNTIDRNENIKIVLEWNASQFLGHGTNPVDVIDFFRSKLFKPYRLDWQDGSASEISTDFLLSTQEHFCGILFQR